MGVLVVHPLSRSGISSFIVAVVAVALVGVVPVASATAAAPVEHTVTFTYTGAQVSWNAPTDVTSLRVAIAGAAGTGLVTAHGGQGGLGVIDLGAAYAGRTFQVLVGGIGLGSLMNPLPGNFGLSGGGGTFLSQGSAIVAVAGGGGAATNWFRTVDSSEVSGYSAGGAGGAPGQGGGSGMYEEIATTAGAGATGGMPGVPGIGYGGIDFQGGAGTITSTVGGVIDPGLGGYAGHTSGAGGGGFAGGGGGSTDFLVIDLQDDIMENGTGGGGSGYLAPGLTATSTGLNTGDGYVTFTYTLATASSITTDVASSTLPDTGTAPGGLMGFGGVLLLLGGIALITRRRSQSHS